MQNLIKKYQQVVATYPNNIAIEEGTKKITHQELWDLASRYARLLEKNISSGSLVEVLMPKSINYVAAILGCWIYDCYFVPINATLPKKRIDFIRKNSKASFTITKKTRLPVKGVEKIVKLKESHPAYLIYTSGSTGTPKGVLISHKGLPYVINEQIKMFQLTENSRIFFFLSISFDAFLSDILTTLLAGATLIIDTKPNISERLHQILNTKSITHIDLPPSLLSFLIEGGIPSNLETVVIGGESPPTQILKKLASKVNVINVYGPTEATICTSMIKCNTNKWNGPNIGHPIKGTEYFVLDEKKKEIKQGVGELYIAGVQLAIGYYNLPQLNKDKFIFYKGKRLYRTSDIVRVEKDGLYFVGRTDRQVKVRGQLVALEEVEQTLISHKNIKRCAVIFEDNQLKAFIEVKNKNTNLKIFLEERLPSYMTPSLNIVDKVQTLPNGKIDYSALNSKQMEFYKYKKEKDKSSLYILLERLWEDVLNKRNIQPNDNFFQIGGNSLAVLELVMKAKKNGINMAINTIADSPTLNELNNIIKNSKLSDGIPVKKLIKYLPSPKQTIQTIGKVSSVSSNKDILITGATGFLGIYTLLKLIKTKRKIHLIIRAKDKSSALKKLFERAKSFGLKLPNLSNVKIHLGDLTKEKMQLKEWGELSRIVSDVYHIAAQVNMAKSLKELYPDNVEALNNIINFSSTGILKHIHYASTLSVFVATDNNEGTFKENTSIDNCKIVYGGYAQTKWIAEKMLSNYSLPNTIYRFGLLTGNSKTGMCSSHDYLMTFIKGIKSLGVILDGNKDNLSIDITPIDFAADLFVKLSLLKSPLRKQKIFHITSAQSFTLKQIKKRLSKEGVRVILQHQWNDVIAKKELSFEENAAVMALCRLNDEDFKHLRGMDLFQSTNTKFDIANVIREFPKIKIPKINEALLNLYVKNHHSET